MIGLTVEGQLSIHLHGLMSGPDMKVYGGHFLEKGNPVLVTVEIVIHSLHKAVMQNAAVRVTVILLF
jgi:hypothetical protein